MAEVKTYPSRRALLAASAALLAMLATPAAGLTVNGYSAADNDRFASGYPTAPVPSTSSSFLGAGYDWSGVGWLTTNGKKCFALLGPCDALIANHYPLGVSSTAQFLSASGQVESDTVAAQPGVHSGYTNDLAVATLASPIPASDNITYYSILFEGYNPNSYVGDNVLSMARGQTTAWGNTAGDPSWDGTKSPPPDNSCPGQPHPTDPIPRTTSLTGTTR